MDPHYLWQDAEGGEREGDQRRLKQKAADDSVSHLLFHTSGKRQVGKDTPRKDKKMVSLKNRLKDILSY
jgi:hypothetical protein